MTNTTQIEEDHAAIDESITSRQEVSGFAAVLRTQPFWVFLALVTLGLVMSFVSDAFMTERNMFNITRNMAFFGIMALGMSAVICTAGIDLSVGSLVGLSGIVTGLIMQVWLWHRAWVLGLHVGRNRRRRGERHSYRLSPNAAVRGHTWYAINRRFPGTCRFQ